MAVVRRDSHGRRSAVADNRTGKTEYEERQSVQNLRLHARPRALLKLGGKRPTKQVSKMVVQRGNTRKDL